MTDTTRREIDYLTEQFTRMESNMIDPRDFGRLEAEVQSLRAEVAALRTDMRTLLDLTQRSKGAIWAGMTIASAIGAAATFLIDRVWLR